MFLLSRKPRRIARVSATSRRRTGLPRIPQPQLPRRRRHAGGLTSLGASKIVRNTYDRVHVRRLGRRPLSLGATGTVGETVAPKRIAADSDPVEFEAEATAARKYHGIR